MAESDKELEEQLTEIGNRLIDPPSSAKELLPLLHEAGIYISKVEQSPSKLMHKALSPSLEALVSRKLFRHPNIDVQVAVAFCICEITRITAPEAPYNDEQMKDIFQLIVSSFKNLHDKSSSSYDKRISILETVAKIRSCVVMLDLECEGLIIEMFQHFLKEIRDHHLENVFSSMEIIMILVLEESEDISMELLSPILSVIKIDNEGILPIARKLAESVLKSSATKVRPYLIQAVKSLGLSFGDYSKVVASICQDASSVEELNDAATDEHTADRSNSIIASGNEAVNTDRSNPISAPADAVKVQKEIATEAAPLEQVSVNNGSLKSAVTNGVQRTKEDESFAASEKKENVALADQTNTADTFSNAEPDVMEAEKIVNPGHQEEQTPKQRARVSNSQKSADSSNTSYASGSMEDEAVPDVKDSGKDLPGSFQDGNNVEVVISSENTKEIDIHPSLPKAMEDESGDVASTSSGESIIANFKRSKNTARQKKNVKKVKLLKEVTPSSNGISKKTLQRKTNAQVKLNKTSGKKVASGASSEEKTLTPVDEPKKGKATTETKGNKLEQSNERLDEGGNNIEESSKQTEDRKKRTRGKAIGKGVSKVSTKDDDKEVVSSPKSKKPREDECLFKGTPKTNSKRKQSQEKKEFHAEDCGTNLLGARIKVWWPADQCFYVGVVHSYDSTKKRHLVLYDDGDQEILILKKERWELIEGVDSKSDEEEAADQKCTDGLSDMAQKKKTKTGADQSTKKDKIDVLLKSGKRASPNKSKAATKKSGLKSKEASKPEDNGKLENEIVGMQSDDTATPKMKKEQAKPEVLDSLKKIIKQSRSNAKSSIVKVTNNGKLGSSNPKRESDDEASNPKRKTPTSCKGKSEAKSAKKQKQ